jgi:periplasmic divalent cation tolerance protein
MSDTSSNPMTEYCLVLVTAGSQAEANKLAHTLVQEHLAACVGLMPITSVYIWDNQVQQGNEWQLLIKTRTQAYSTLAERILQLHSYEVPEIVALPIVAGSSRYLNWIDHQVNLHNAN